MNVHSPTRTRLPTADSLTIFRSPSPSSDYFTQTTPSTTKLSDPRAQLLERWQSIADHISSKRISWDVVIALNRNLDTAENILSSRAPLDESWKARLEDSGLGISNVADSESDIQFVSKKEPAVVNAPEDVESADLEQEEPQRDEALLARVSQAVAQLRKRQHECKVCSLQISKVWFLISNHHDQHLHDMVILKSEKQAERISQLHRQVDQLYVMIPPEI